jgi:GTP-binding protein
MLQQVSLDLDEAMADVLRRSSKPVLLAVNKVDNHDRLLEATEFYGLGFDHIFFISSMTGSGSGELLDALTELIEESAVGFDDSIPKFAIMGQPNVGKVFIIKRISRTGANDRQRDCGHYQRYNSYAL